MSTHTQILQAKCIILFVNVAVHSSSSSHIAIVHRATVRVVYSATVRVPYTVPLSV
jgi:hypothetical protein